MASNLPFGKATLPESALGAHVFPNDVGGIRPLALAWTGTDQAQHLNVGRSSNPTTFAGLNTVTLNESSPYGPALAFGNNTLFLAWTGANTMHSLNILSSSDGITFSNKVTLSESSGTRPALVFLDKLYLLWSGDDQNHSLNILQSTDGINFTNKITLSESSDFPPSLTRAISGQYFLGWTGRDAAHSLNILNNAEFSSGPTNLQVKQTYSESSIAGVTLGAIEAGHVLYMAWTGSDSQLNFVTIAGYI